VELSKNFIELWPYFAAVAFSCTVFSLIFTSFVVGGLNKQHKRQMKRMETNISVLTSGSLGMGQKMIAIEGKLHKLQASLNELKQSDIDYSYTRAQKLIEQGVDSRAVAANSGLSSSEINLMRLMYQQEKSVCDFAHE
jgi:hypothetical protein